MQPDLTTLQARVREAPAPDRFNNALAAARRHKLRGWWQGSAFRSHPCGVIRNGIIFANQWNTNGYCYAEVILDPTSPIRFGQNDPAVSGDPYPRPERGGTLRVYYTGQWSQEDGVWRDIILATLDDLEREISEANNIQIQKDEQHRSEAAAAHAARVEAARSALTQEPAR